MLKKPPSISKYVADSSASVVVSTAYKSWGFKNTACKVKLKGGSDSSEFNTARSRASLGSVYERPAGDLDDMTIMYQNVRSYRKREDEVLRKCEQYQLDGVLLLECFRPVELDFFEFRHNSNLFRSPVGRNSSGIFLGCNDPIYKIRNPVGDFIKYKVNNVWFVVVYVSKNNIANNIVPDDQLADNDSDIESDHDRLGNRAILQEGRDAILNNIRDLFLTQNQVLVMGDWNGLKDQIVPFMENLHATRLETAPTYTTLQGGHRHYNDLIFYKGLDVELVEQVSRGDDTFSDHDAIIFRMKNINHKKGSLKMFSKYLKDEQLLARWKQVVQEVNQPNYLGHFFSADMLYESINTACNLTHVRNPNYIHKKRAKYTTEQYEEIHNITRLIYAAQGEERTRLKRRLNRYKYRRRKENWREYIGSVIRSQDHWKLFKTMDRNNSILSKKEVKDNILADRSAYVDSWTRELTTIYARKELPPLPPELEELENTNMDSLLDSAQDIQVSMADVKMALGKTKKSKSPGLNQINYYLLKLAFDADPEFFTAVCNYEVNCIESVNEFKKSRFVPIFKNKPGNDRSNPRHYRLIAILDCLQKIIESIVVDKFADQLELLAGKFQHGFIRKRGTHTAAEDYLKFSKVFKARGVSQHIAFVDIEKAYPSVDLELMAKLCVLRLGNFKYFHKMHRMCNTTAFLDLGFTLVAIPVESGLKEGSKQSCLFFDLVVGEIVRILDRKHHLGLQRDISYFLQPIINRIIAYADDITLMSQSKATLKLVVSTLVEFTAYFGLKVNVGKSSYMLNNFGEVQNATPLSVQSGDGSIEIPVVEETLFLGFGIKANKSVTIGNHISIRDSVRDKDVYFKKIKRLRYTFKGDVAIIRDLFNMFYVARFYYGVNKLLTTLDEFKEFFSGMTVDNWHTREEPHYIKKLNCEMATDLGKIAPGNALKFLCAAVLCIKPLHVKHIKEIRKEDIREYWLAKSASRCVDYVRLHWSNIVNCLKNRQITFDGRRHFLAACYGHVSLSMKYGRYENTFCWCGLQYNVPNALSSASWDECCYCTLPPVRGSAQPRNLQTVGHIEFMESVKKFTMTRFFKGWLNKDA